MAKFVVQKHSDPARRLAYEVLLAVAEQGAYSNLALPKALRKRQLSAQDAAFATELVYGTIRSQRFYDAVLEQCVDRPFASLDLPVKVLTRMGAHQILATRVPSHAAVSETVNIARQVTSTGPAGLINAALRRVSERSAPDWERAITANASRDERLGIIYSHPDWIVRALRSALNADGKDRESELKALLEANNTPPYLTLVARPGLISAEELADEAEEILNTQVALGQWVDSAVTIRSGDPGMLPSVRSALAGVQDEGSQIVARLFANVPLHGNDQNWLDLCSGPGGKTAYLGAIGRNRGVSVLANEINPKRAALVEKNCVNLGNVHVQIGDGRQLSQTGFDRVLVDAPCTGLGALRRRAESRYRRVPEDLSVLTRLQAQLLDSAFEVTRPGGLIVYSTCSPHLAETRLICESFVQDKEVTPVDLRALAGEVLLGKASDWEGSGPYLQLWTHKHGTDAMFIAAFYKSS